MTTLSQPQSKFLMVNGLRLHYLDWGNPSAPPVVYVHGYTSSAQAFSAPTLMEPVALAALARFLGAPEEVASRRS